MKAERTHVLFICSKNQWRSPTAERIYRNDPDLAVRSAGTSSKARRPVTIKDLQWADLVMVMESKHRRRLMADFPKVARHKAFHVLEIEDRYPFMDPVLIEELRTSIDPLLEEWR